METVFTVVETILRERCLSCFQLLRSVVGITQPRSLRFAEDEFLDALIDARIDFTDRCCKRAGLTGMSSDVAAYSKTSFSKEYSSPYPGATYNAEKATACVTTFLEADCTPAKTTNPIAQSCKEAYRRGSTEVGESFNTSFDCAQPPDQRIECVPRYERVGDRIERVSALYTQFEELGEGEICVGLDRSDDVPTARDCPRNFFCGL